MANNTLSERLNEIQDFVNKPRRQYALQQDRPLIPMIFSCISTISDTEEALESYLKTDADSLDLGVKYIFVYGALQALYVQQDAIKNLHEALDIPYAENMSLKDIRDIRNNATGHPTKRGNKKAFNFIDSKTLNAQGFQLMTVRPENENKSEYKDVNVPNLIATQNSIIKDILTKLIEKLREQEVEHRKKFEGKKLASALQPTEHLFLEINEAIINPNSPHDQLPETHVYEIAKFVEKFMAGLEDRGEPDFHICHIYNDLDKFLQCLIVYFRNHSGIHISREYALVFSAIAQGHIEQLKTVAEDYDRMYCQLD